MSKGTWVFLAVLSVFLAGGFAYRHFAQELDSRGATRLMRALEENDTEKTEELLVTADVHARDKSGQTALFYAARHAEQPQIIHKLLLAGFDPLTTNKQGQTPLIAAAASNPHPAVIRVLARQGGVSAAQQHNKDQALFAAARSNGAPVIKMLLIAHADPAATDANGHQVADYLVENTRLTEVEKTDLRQAMLLLEILQAREAFADGFTDKKPTKKEQTPVVKPKPTKKPVEKKLEEPIPQKPTETTKLSSVEKEMPPVEKAEPIIK